MSSIASMSSAPSALPPVNIPPHGHKRGAHATTADDSGSGTAAQIPAWAAHNLFGSLLRTLEQVIGVQSTTTTPIATAAPAAAAGGAPASAAASTTQSAGALLHNYLNNLAQNLEAKGSQSPKPAGSNLSISA